MFATLLASDPAYWSLEQDHLVARSDVMRTLRLHEGDEDFFAVHKDCRGLTFALEANTLQGLA